MSFVIDFSQAKTFDPIEGTYDAVLMEHSTGLSQAGEPVSKFVWTLTGSEVEGRKIWATKSLQTQALWSVKAWYIAMGADPDDFDRKLTKQQIEHIGNGLIGRECRLKLAIGKNPNTGEPSQQVQAVYSASLI